MAILKSTVSIKIALGLLLAAAGPVMSRAAAQAPAATPTAPKVGTIKAVSGNGLTVATDAGPTVTITVPDAAKVQQLAAGSVDPKTATPSQLSNIAVGDRVLVTGKAGDTPDAFTARTVYLMKSGDIAQKNAAQQADWKKNGTGGIVSAVDPATGAIAVTAGAKKIAVSTSSKTDFRRFTGDSVKFQDAKPGTLAQIQVGDQIQARGVKSEDGLSVQAAEVVSGSFKNLSGLVASVDAASGKITLKDLATKKMFTVYVSANSDLHNMPLPMAKAFAARTQAGAAGGAAAGDAGGGLGSPGGQGGPAGGARRAGADLSQMIARMPTAALADLKVNDAVMIVASEPSPGSTTVTAVTLLSGVEPILTANPNGGMNLSGWSMGGGPAE